MQFIPVFLIFLALTLLNNTVSSQTHRDSLFVSKVSGNLTDYYSSSLSTNALIYNGKMFQDYFPFEPGNHVFFLANEFTPGTVIYDGFLYKKVDLKYDLVADQLIMQHPSFGMGIILNPKYVSSFTLSNHTFLRIPDNPANIKNQGQYYDALYQGQVSLVVKRIKKISEVVGQDRVKRTVSAQNKYYLYKDSVYTQVTNKKTLLKVLGNNLSKSQQFIRANKLNFRKDKENSMLSLVKFYDSISR